ncbi:MAG: class I SAM-dependent methyltransferase [Chthoniobacterales bacterium]
MDFEITDLRSRNFQPRLYGVGAWTDNLHFAYDLIATLRPHLFVELGTDRGESYFAFCQSTAENATGTRCVAIDSWRGDAHAGGYDETTRAEVAAHNRAHYENFSRLLRTEFDDALTSFADESIDLLHLDGLHTEAAVRGDVENWLPKLRPRGLLLMHDVSVRGRGFGVWKVWEELKTRGRSYTFRDGPGLGVWQKPPPGKLCDPIETLLDGPSDRTTALEKYYREQAHGLQAKIAELWRAGSIRETAAGRQTTIQVFHSRDGKHREEDSVFARIGHESWKEISIALPTGAGVASLRIDFLSAFTTIEIASLRVTSDSADLFAAADAAGFAQIRVAGDGERIPDSYHLRVRITGIDPQLYLPALSAPEVNTSLRVEMRLRVSAPA